MYAAAVLPCLTAILALLIVWRLPSHRPLAVAFATAAAVDIGTDGVLHLEQLQHIDAGEASHARLALGLALPAVSAWACAATFGVAFSPWLAGVAWACAEAVAWLGPRWAWEGVMPAARALAVVVEVAAWAAWRARGRGAASSISHRVAGLVVACDAVGLALEAALGREGLPRWGMVAQGGAAVLQALWLARVTVVRRAP